MRYAGKNIKMTVNNLKVSYNDEGPIEGPTIIFIHGFPFTKSTWDKQAEALKDNFRVIAYDVRGHGNTEVGYVDYSIELFVSDLLGLMDALKLDKAVLCGLSMGGYVALHAIKNYPKRFEGLILSDTQCMADTSEGKEKRLKTIENIKGYGTEKYADESIKNLFAPESIATKKEEIAAVREMIINTSEQTLCNTLLALSNREETCTKLPEINVPVLILVGKEDKITPPEVARMMHEKISGSSLNLVAHAGHLPNIENPSEFNNKLKKFLQQFSISRRLKEEVVN